MAIQLENIYSLSEFQRNTKKHMAKLKKSGEPAVLTINGQAELVVQSAKAYQQLLDAQDLIESMIAVQEGIEQVERGEGIDVDEAFDLIAKKHGFDLK